MHEMKRRQRLMGALCGRGGVIAPSNAAPHRHSMCLASRHWIGSPIVFVVFWRQPVCHYMQPEHNVTACLPCAGPRRVHSAAGAAARSSRWLRQLAHRRRSRQPQSSALWVHVPNEPPYAESTSLCPCRYPVQTHSAAQTCCQGGVEEPCSSPRSSPKAAELEIKGFGLEPTVYCSPAGGAAGAAGGGGGGHVAVLQPPAWHAGRQPRAGAAGGPSGCACFVAHQLPSHVP